MSEQDFTDPDFVLGAVLAQVEDLTPADKRRVLQEALASIEPAWGHQAMPYDAVNTERYRGECRHCSTPIKRRLSGEWVHNATGDAAGTGAPR